MRYVTSLERIGLRKGMEKGLQQGLQQGQAALLKEPLVLRFGQLPDWVETKLAQAEPAQLTLWAKRLLDATALARVFADD